MQRQFKTGRVLVGIVESLNPGVQHRQLALSAGAN